MGWEFEKQDQKQKGEGVATVQAKVDTGRIPGSSSGKGPIANLI